MLSLFSCTIALLTTNIKMSIKDINWHFQWLLKDCKVRKPSTNNGGWCTDCPIYFKIFSSTVSQRKWPNSELLNSQLDSWKLGKLFPLSDGFHKSNDKRVTTTHHSYKIFFNCYFFDFYLIFGCRPVAVGVVCVPILLSPWQYPVNTLLWPVMSWSLGIPDTALMRGSHLIEQ